MEGAALTKLLKELMENLGKSKDSDWNSEINLEKGGTSYYHQLLNKRMVLNARDDMKSLLHRLIFVSKLSPELADKRDLAGYWEQQFQQSNQGDSVTGLLLLYPSYTIHVLESSSDVLYWVLRELKNMKRQGSRALVLEPRILVMSHNIPNRLFSQWSYKVLDVPTRHLQEKYNDEASDGIIIECLTKILKIGMHLAKYPKGAKNIPDSVFEKVPELTIPQGFISHLLQCKEFLTPDQFLELYDGPLNILLDSGDQGHVNTVGCKILTSYDFGCFDNHTELLITIHARWRRNLVLGDGAASLVTFILNASNIARFQDFS